MKKEFRNADTRHLMHEIERLKKELAQVLEELAQVYASKDLYRRKFWEEFKLRHEVKEQNDKLIKKIYGLLPS